MPIYIQQEGSTNVPQTSMTIVLGSGLNLGMDSNGLPLVTASTGETLVYSSNGGDDTQAIQNAIWLGLPVRLGPGTFNVSAIIDVGAGVMITGAGSGSQDAFTIIQKADYPDCAFRFGDSTDAAGLQNIRFEGPGMTTGTGNTAIKVAPSSPFTHGFRFRDLVINGFCESAFYINNCAQVELENIIATSIGGDAIEVDTAHSVRLSTVRVAISTRGIHVIQSQGVQLDACEVEAGSDVAYEIETSSEVVLDACVSRGAVGVPLVINGSQSVIVNGFRSDDSNASPMPPDRPHLVVDGGSTQAVISGFGVVNGTTTPTVEADVGGAGGPVVVTAHGFTAGAISSSGNFAPVATNPIP